MTARAEDDCRELKLSSFQGDETNFAGFDALTGRDLRNYPPSKDAEHRHLTIELTIPSMDAPLLEGRATLTFAPIAAPVGSLTLDARAMNIRSVRVPGRKASFGYDGNVLSIAIEPAVPLGEEANVVIDYELNDPPDGLLWTGENVAMPDRTPQIHTQGEAESNSYWFPCRDFPNGRLTTELIARVPEGFQVCSNGRLVSHDQETVVAGTPGGGGDAEQKRCEVWHWVQDKSHVPYLVTMVVGKFDVVDVGSKALPMPVYVPPGRGGDVPATYGRTAEMVALYERLVQQKYAWDKYAQIVVTNFNAGGMENTSATSMYDSAIIDRDDLDDYDIEGLIAHELAHQWFGDLLTCNSWEHLWLNEGFATYFSGLWAEGRALAKDEPAWMSGEDAYERSVLGWFDTLISGDRGSAPEAVGMTSKVYANPGEVFGRPSNPYPKGASILHMLRRRLGDDVFFKGLKVYVERHKFQTVETSDLRRVMEEVSGESLEQFFWQWCTRPGIPRVDVEVSWDRNAHLIKVTGTQTQKIDGDNPAYEFELPVVATLDDGSTVRCSLAFQGRDAAAEVSAEHEPRFVAVDPQASVLAELKIKQGDASWIRQLKDGPTLYSRMQALRNLSKEGAAKEEAALLDVVFDAKLSVSLRLEAYQLVAKRQSIAQVIAPVGADRWELREARANRLGELCTPGKNQKLSEGDRSELVRALLKITAEDESLKVRCAAIRAMGKLHDPELEPMIYQALRSESHSDALRQAGIDAAVSLDTKDALHQVAMICEPRYFARTRASAVDAVSKLAGQDSGLAFEILARNLNDRIVRVQRTAADGMVRLKDKRGVAAFDQAIARERSWAMKRQLEQKQGDLEKELAKDVSGKVTQASTPRK